MEANVLSFASYLHSSLAQEYFDGLDAQLSKLDAVQEQPQLIDPHVQGLLDPITAYLVHFLSKPLPTFVQDLYRIVYHLCKLRGAKVIVKLLPNHVHLLNPVLNTLQSKASDTTAWHSRYVLFLWLSLIVMAPFDLKTFDEANKTDGGVAVRILKLAQTCLGASSREREAAGLLIARTVTRKDVSATFIPDYLQQSLATWANDHCTVQFRIGFLVSLCEIFRIGNRDILEAHVQLALDALRQIESDDFNSNTLLRKLRMKLSQRLALTMLKPSRASWRYKNDPKSYGVGNDTIEEEPDEPSQEVEEVMGVLLEGIQDRDTVVRYSAAKGIGRVTSRLPQEFAEEIVDAIQGLMQHQTHTESGFLKLNEEASDATWQGCCLAIAELCRHGALLPGALHQALPIVILALQFDIRKGSHSIGTVVRDAACYLLWSVLRCYTSQVLRPLANQIATTLIVVALFDREISVRRAASAAYQEGVGRHAEGLFPDGIAVLTLADFQSVGQRQNAFMNVAPQIFAKEAYQDAILQYIVHTSLRHWDRDIRELASQTLAELYLVHHNVVEAQWPMLEQYKASLDVNARHGAFYAAGELCRVATKELKSQISDFGHALPDHVLDGISASLMGHAFSHFVRHTAFDKPGLDSEYYTQILKCLKVSDANARHEAGLSLASLTHNQALLADFELYANQMLKLGHSPLEKGIIQAVGLVNCLSRPQTLKSFVTLLVPLTRASGNTLKDDPETRQLSITSIGQLGKQWLQLGFPAEKIMRSILTCLQDYAVDARGDVGSWVRASAIKASLDVLPVLPLDLEPRLLQAVYSALLQQCLSKIDNLHVAAVNAILQSVPVMPADMHHVAKIIANATQALEAGRSAERIPSLFLGLLNDPVFGDAILREICILVGSGGHPWAQSSRNALVAFLDNCPLDLLSNVLNSVLALIEEYSQDDRVLVPTLETLSLLVEHQVPERVVLAKYDFNRLFETVQKSCLRSRHVPKLASSMRIYRGLMSILPSSHQVHQRCWKKLGLLLKHTVPRLRWLAAEQLFIALSEQELKRRRNSFFEYESWNVTMSILMDTEWTAATDSIATACKQVQDHAI